MTTILVVDDEPRIVALLEKGLKAAGFDTLAAGTGVAALAAASSADLVVLDLGLPDMDGLEVLAQLRSRPESPPVVILTANDEVPTIVHTLDLGADDYVTKPFRFEELLARVKARLRPPDRLEHGGVTLDLRSRCADVGDGPVELTAREFDLLAGLMRRAGDVADRATLLEESWGAEADPDSNVIDVYVGYLRRKLAPWVVETVRGKGYRAGTRPVTRAAPRARR